MNPIRHIRRLAAVLAGALLAFWRGLRSPRPPRSPEVRVRHRVAALARGVLLPCTPQCAAPATPIPAGPHTVIVGGMPGWQITLIALGAALAAAAVAVLADRARAARLQANAAATGARRSTSSGPARSGSATNTVVHAALGQQPVAADVVVGGAGVMLPRVGGGGRPAAQPLDDRRGLVAVAADDRHVEHGDLDLRRVAAGLPRSAARSTASFAVERGQVRRAGCSRRRAGPRSAASALARAADDDRDLGQPGAGSRSSPAARPARPGRPWCRAATAPAASRWPSRAGRAGPARAGTAGRTPACSRSHQPAPMPQNARPPLSASSVATVLARMPGARNVTGVTSVPRRRPGSRPASMPSVTHGSGIGSQARPTCGIWIR